MKGEVLVRELSTGDVFFFDRSSKNLFLIGTKHVKEWKASDQSMNTLNQMQKDKKARRFTKVMLEQLRSAVRHIDFKI